MIRTVITIFVKIWLIFPLEALQKRKSKFIYRQWFFLLHLLKRWWLCLCQQQCIDHMIVKYPFGLPIIYKEKAIAFQLSIKTKIFCRHWILLLSHGNDASSEQPNTGDAQQQLVTFNLNSYPRLNDFNGISARFYVVFYYGEPISMEIYYDPWFTMLFRYDIEIENRIFESVR